MSESMKLELLLVEDDESFRDTAARWMSRMGHRVEQSSNGQEALKLLDQRYFEVAIIDMNMPGISGLELLQRMQELGLETQSIVLTGQATVENAVEAMKLGACDYLTKPFPLAELERRAILAAQRGRLQQENHRLRQLLERQRPAQPMIGASAAMQEVFRLIDRVARTDKAALIQGESGTGKELVARAIQEQSSRSHKPLVTVNCAALSESLVESELFGHEKGAFTGASQRKDGLFEVADGGTLFVDEIGELPLTLQPKLLRVLEDGSLRRVGSLQERRVNVRVIAATNRSLQQEVDAKRFREDLFYRLNVVSIQLPPLRDRHGDIPLLVNQYLGKDWRIEPNALSTLEAYHWPGNVRQLINALDRAMILADGNLITLNDLHPDLVRQNGHAAEQLAKATSTSSELASIEREHILAVLNREHGNKAHTARCLGIHRRKLYRLLAKHGIET